MDFRQLIAELKGIGLTQAEIGRGIKRDQSVISDLERTGGKRIPYETAEALKKFHAQQMKARRAA